MKISNKNTHKWRIKFKMIDFGLRNSEIFGVILKNDKLVNCRDMIAPKMIAIMAAIALGGTAPAAINAFADNVLVVNEEDNDETGQANIQGIGVLSPQTNTVNDNDVQVGVGSIDDRDACGFEQQFAFVDC
jgi:hypothetical protein